MERDRLEKLRVEKEKVEQQNREKLELENKRLALEKEIVSYYKHLIPIVRIVNHFKMSSPVVREILERHLGREEYLRLKHQIRDIGIQKTKQQFYNFISLENNLLYLSLYGARFMLRKYL